MHAHTHTAPGLGKLSPGTEGLPTIAFSLTADWSAILPSASSLTPVCHVYVYTTFKGQPDLGLPHQGQATSSNLNY